MEWYNDLGLVASKETVHSYILSAYHIRQDDAYAAVGSCRGMLKKMLPEFRDDPWADPMGDLKRFVARGAQRSALPPWWNDGDLEALVRCNGLTGVTMGSPEEPSDFLKVFGVDQGGATVAFLRKIGCAFEGPPSWKTSTDRDSQTNRAPLVGRRDEDTMTCMRCRAGGPTAPIGIYSTCPHCDFSGSCPKCDSDLEGGACNKCGCTPQLYTRTFTTDPALAATGVRLACDLKLPTLSWYAVGCRPMLCEASQLREAKKGAMRLVGSGGSVARSTPANKDDHLAESLDPQLLVTLEATLMFKAGVLLLKKALRVPDTQEGMQNVLYSEGKDNLENIDVKRVDVPTLRVGCQLFVDANLACTECDSSSTAVDDVFILAVGNILQRNWSVIAKEFGYTAGLFLYLASRGCSMVDRAQVRSILDTDLDKDENKFKNARKAGPIERYAVAHLLYYRSVDKLTRFRDYKGALVDLDLAILMMPDGMPSYHEQRASLRINQQNVSGAMKDFGGVVAADHEDYRFMSSHLYVMAELTARKGVGNATNNGREFFERAKRAEKRHRYLFGTPHQQKGEGAQQKQMTELELLEELAHRRFALPKEQGKRLQRISQSELDRQSFVVMGLPPQELQRFNEAASAASSSAAATGKPSSSSSSSSSPAIFVDGDAVMVYGLQAAAAQKYNGCLGCIEGCLSEEGGRYTVRVRDPSAPSDSKRATTVRVKASNLQSVSRAAAEHKQAPLPAAARAPPSSADESMGKAFAGLLNAASGGADLSARVSVLEARAAIKDTTDEALNLSQPCGDGDQSFVCEDDSGGSADKGRRLKLARVSGMDFFDLLQRGASPFSMACFTGQLEKAQALVNVAKSGGSRKLAALVEKRESMMRFTPLMFCISGANYPNPAGSRAAVSQHVALARMLLENGALPNARDIAGFTAFHLATNATAANETVLAIAAMLPQYGGDPNVRNRFGQVPLIEAVMSTRLDCIRVLVEAGADPSIEDLSMRTLHDNAKKSKKRSPAQVQVVPTPRSLAIAQPAVMRLFSVASLSRTEPDASYGCSAPGCDLPGLKVCLQCRRASYCGAACQKKDWKAHKHICSVAVGELTRVHIAYDTPQMSRLKNFTADQSAEQPKSRPFRVGKPHTIKLQLPMTFDGSVDAIMGYDRLRTRTFEIGASNNDPDVFQEVVRAIRESGVSGGLKGYVNAWAANEHSREAGGNLDVDLRCMRPAQPW